MKLEKRYFAKGKPEEKIMMLFIAESEDESLLIDDFFGAEIPTIATTKVTVCLADDYGEHYLRMEKQC